MQIENSLYFYLQMREVEWGFQTLASHTRSWLMGSLLQHWLFLFLMAVALNFTSSLGAGRERIWLSLSLLSSGYKV